MGYTIESIRAWRNLPFAGLNSPRYVFSIPQDPVEEGSSFPIAEKWEPTGTACEIWRFLQEGETDMSSLIGCYLSHGLPSALGPPEGNRLAQCLWGLSPGRHGGGAEERLWRARGVGAGGSPAGTFQQGPESPHWSVVAEVSVGELEGVALGGDPQTPKWGATAWPGIIEGLPFPSFHSPNASPRGELREGVCVPPQHSPEGMHALTYTSSPQNSQRSLPCGKRRKF